jgi:hypothetical protein
LRIENIYIKKLKKALFIAILFSILNSQFSILHAAPYEIDLRYGFGISELAFNSVPGVVVSVYPVKNFGLAAGFEYSWRWQTRTSSPAEENPVTQDNEGDDYILKYTIERYKEELSGEIFQIPIMLKYSNESYYLASGLKIGLARNHSVTTSYEGLETEAYYTKYNAPLTKPLFRGLGPQRDSSFKTEISSERLIMLALEGGIKWKLNDNFSFAGGIFADYSFNKGFSRNLPPLVELAEIENSNNAKTVVNDNWKSWQPWSIGVIVKLSFSPAPQSTTKRDSVSLQTIRITVIEPNIPPPPVQVPGDDPQYVEEYGVAFPQEPGFRIPRLPAFLLNRNADFVFHYPETRTSPSDSLHIILISQIADTLRAAPGTHLHCVGYSEKLLSESVAYETALQRSLRIRYTLSRFYGIEESRISIYSQGSRGDGYRRAECFIL